MTRDTVVIQPPADLVHVARAAAAHLREHWPELDVKIDIFTRRWERTIDTVIPDEPITHDGDGDPYSAFVLCCHVDDAIERAAFALGEPSPLPH